MKIRGMLLVVATLVTAALGIAGSPASAKAQAGDAGTYYVTARAGFGGTGGTARFTAFGELKMSPAIDIEFRPDETTTSGPHRWGDLGPIRFISLGKSRNSSTWWAEYIDVYSAGDDVRYHCELNTYFSPQAMTRFYSC